MMCSPPSSATPSPSRMSVPRPAMLVAMVTAPASPAREMISASSAWYFAFRTLCLTPLRFSISAIRSEFSIETVPTSTGWLFLCRLTISSTTALNLPSTLLYTTSGIS
ncbi:hypothetical protein D1872_271230 [compost metagenome]